MLKKYYKRVLMNYYLELFEIMSEGSYRGPDWDGARHIS